MHTAAQAVLEGVENLVRARWFANLPKTFFTWVFEAQTLSSASSQERDLKSARADLEMRRGARRVFANIFPDNPVTV